MTPTVTRILGRRSLGEELGEFRSNGLLASHRAHVGGEVLASHEHGASYLCIVLAGRYLQTAGSEMECSRGSLVSHPAGHVHSNQFGPQPARCVNLYLDPAWLDDTALAGLVRDYQQVRVDPRDGCLARLEREITTHDIGSTLGVASAALDIVSRSLRLARDANPAWLRRVVEAITADLAEPPALATLAAAAGVHPAHLCRSFRAATGETIGAYSRRTRLEAAYAMLGCRQSIAEIASATGFYDQAHFARCFRRQFGASPRALRAQISS